MLTQSDLQKIKNLLKQTNAPIEKLADAQYIQKILKKLATKEDIKNFATKNELKHITQDIIKKLNLLKMSKVEKNTDMIPSLKEKINDHEERIKKIEIQNPLSRTR